MTPGPKQPDDREGNKLDECGSAIEPGTFRIERLLPGPVERIWAYLTEPEKRKKWFGAGPMELQMGGRVELQFRFSELTTEKTPPGEVNSCEVPGRVTRCDPPRLLSYTWGDGPDASEVTFQLTPQGKDVLLVITHRRLGDRTKMVSVASGWHTHLAILADRLSGRMPRPFWTMKASLQQQYGERLSGLGA